MSTIETQLICNTFGGIRKKSSVFSNDLITASYLQNVELYDTGINGGIGIRTVKGNKSVCDMLSSDEKIIGIFSSVQKNNTYCFLYVENQTEGKIYRYDLKQGTLTLMRELLTPTGNSCGTDFAQGYSDLFIFSNGEDMVIIEMAADEQVKDFVVQDMDGRYVKGLGLVSYNNRLWIFSDNVLWYSVQSNIYDFATADSEKLTSSGYIEYGKKITAVIPYLKSLAVFFADCSIIISGEYPYSQTEESPGGCAGYNSLIFHGTELYFYDNIKQGIFSFKEIILGDKTLGDNIAKEIQSELYNIDNSKLNQIRTLSVVLSEKNEIWLLLPTNDNYTKILIFDYLHGEWLLRKSQKIYSINIINGILYSGSKGKLLQEYSSETFDGEFIESFYYCTPFNLGSETTLKVLKLPPRVALEGTNYSNTFYVRYIKNYDTSKHPKTKLIKSKFGSFLFWDIGRWDINYWASSILRFIKKLPTANFKALEIQFYTSNPAHSFCIKSIEFSKIKVKQI